MAAKKKTTRKKTTRKKKTTQKKSATLSSELVDAIEKAEAEPTKADELPKIQKLRLALEEARSNPDSDPDEIESIEMALRAAIEIPGTWFE